LTATSKAWHYVRGRDSVRIVIDGSEVMVYGPADRSSCSRFTAELDATLHQAAVEQALVLDGWTLEQMTTERRADHGPEPTLHGRRSPLRMVVPNRRRPS
jgi:hypothetical protein